MSTRNFNSHSASGFTLIEVLVVIAIISVLAVIAIPQFEGHKAGAFDRRAWNDLANVARAEEAYFIENNQYISCDQTTCSNTLPGLGLLSDGVQIEVTAEDNGFTATARHPAGSGAVYTWDS